MSDMPATARPVPVSLHGEPSVEVCPWCGDQGDNLARTHGCAEQVEALVAEVARLREALDRAGKAVLDPELAVIVANALYPTPDPSDTGGAE